MALYTTDLLILGSGPAGYTAGIYAARAGLKTMIVSGNQEGGQLTMTSSIENFPGFEEISGFELMDKMKQQALKLGVQFANDNIVEVDFGNRPFVCSSENGHSYKARAVIVATGSSAKWLNIPSEKKYLGYGVSACATCDGFFYRGRTVAVIGGGNSAVSEALLLSRLCRHVSLVPRRSTFRASAAELTALEKQDNVTFCRNSTVTELLGRERLTGIRLQNGRELEISGLFVCIGRTPVSALGGEQLRRTPDGYYCADETTRTGLPGVFAAGDVRKKQLRQIVTAVSDGAAAAQQAEHYLGKTSRRAEI